jgi:hypothetical protein
MSLVGALTPPGKVATARRGWLVNVAAYTAAGSLTSALVGGALGLLGAAVLPAHDERAAAVALLVLALLALARESGLVDLPLPQLGRQTDGWWAKALDLRPAAILWGLDIGLVFATWLTFSGAWVLAGLAFLNGDPIFGIVLFVAYWLGRAVSVWIGPLLAESATETSPLLTTLFDQRRLFRLAHVVGLLCMVPVLTSWAVTGAAW